MAPKKAPRAPKASKAPRTPKAAKPSKTAVKPLTTGDIDILPQHGHRADLGQGLPSQAPPAKPAK